MEKIFKSLKPGMMLTFMYSGTFYEVELKLDSKYIGSVYFQERNDELLLQRIGEMSKELEKMKEEQECR